MTDIKEVNQIFLFHLLKKLWGSKMDNSDYYFYLCSNDCIKSYPSNNPSYFKIDLLQNLNLEGEWELALLDISFWLNSEKNISELVEEM